MYVGDDVSPDFYGWVFPKYDHVAVGTGTVVNKTAIKQYQQATRDRSEYKTREGKIIRVEAHPIPEHPRAKRVEVQLDATVLCLKLLRARVVCPMQIDLAHTFVSTALKFQVFAGMLHVGNSLTVDDVVQGRVGLVGDAAGYVTKCSGEGIYFAAKSGRMCAEAIVEQSQNGTVMV